MKTVLHSYKPGTQDLGLFALKKENYLVGKVAIVSMSKEPGPTETSSFIGNKFYTNVLRWMILKNY